VDCDLCPEPKKKNARKPFIRPSWHCTTCEFYFCRTCSYFDLAKAATLAKKQKLEEEKFELQSINLDEYMAGQENAEMIQEQSSLMEQPSAGNLNPKVLVEKELEEARAIFEKHGLQLPNKLPGIANGESRASNVILFGNQKEQQSEAGEKKRNNKIKSKAESVISSKSKNCNKRINCDLCAKEMRADHLKVHRGSRLCIKK
jgi:hypothetical protein